MRIVYNSYEGRFSDSPLTIHRALSSAGVAHEAIWLLDPVHGGDFPPGVRTVEYRSPECTAVLESADLVVANSHTDVEWSKGTAPFYLQLWHGTPLKRIHWDVLWAPPGRLERLQRDVDRWDCLVSPSPAATPYLRRAFRYDGEVLESGYPRNDVLNAAHRDEVRARVRAGLGIADDRTAVLYMPTWRDDEVFAEGGRSFALGLNVDRFADALGEEHDLLLRVHYMLTGRLAAMRHDAVHDVSRHLDVSELYLAADVLVTDYSSAMFDWAVTGKPIVFYAYDLEDYASRLRGFYFDLWPEAPGPVARTTDELVGMLGDVPALEAAYAERYEAFRERYCCLEDGRATQRVLERLGLAAPAGRAQDPVP